MNDRKDDFFKLVVSIDTIAILRYLNEHGTGQYKDFMKFVDVDTLQDRVNRLLEYNLITHHSEEEQGTERYKLTDDGRKVLQIMEEIIKTRDAVSGVFMSVIVEGEDSTTTLMRIEVTTTGIHFEIFQGEKGMVRITLSEEKWILSENHINAKCEELHKLKEKARNV